MDAGLWASTMARCVEVEDMGKVRKARAWQGGDRLSWHNAARCGDSS